MYYKLQSNSLITYLKAKMDQTVEQTSACNAGDSGLIPGSERSPGEGNGNALLYSCLENPMDREALQATIHRVVKSWPRLTD